ncbi:ComF family protein, partial [Candidatus Babeliales bacterium]|nr:ComF family protein [Candidatus Babeliales bacterium]
PLFNEKERNKKSILVPMPLHWSRLASRGFNQARVMADVYSKRFDIPVSELIIRAKRTAFQSLLPKKKRVDNVKDAFGLKIEFEALSSECFKDKHLILVDDLCTTGETLRAAVKPLLKLRPASISAIVICRVL